MTGKGTAGPETHSAPSERFEPDPAFERAYSQMMEQALAKSRGERKRRLQEKHSHAEKMLAARVLWPALGSLEGVHPEFEIQDLRSGNRFADYAYQPSRRLGLLIEADGFGPHWRDISRWQFDSDLERQNLLLTAGWKMLRFSYDGIMDKPLRCQQTLLLALAKWGQLTAGAEEKIQFSAYERAILHYSLSFGEEKMTPSQVAKDLGISSRTASTYMQSLADKGYMLPVLSNTGRRMGFTVLTPGVRR